jgi:hypothetical protein
MAKRHRICAVSCGKQDSGNMYYEQSSNITQLSHSDKNCSGVMNRTLHSVLCHFMAWCSNRPAGGVGDTTLWRSTPTEVAKTCPLCHLLSRAACINWIMSTAISTSVYDRAGHRVFWPDPQTLEAPSTYCGKQLIAASYIKLTLSCSDIVSQSTSDQESSSKHTKAVRCSNAGSTS